MMKAAALYNFWSGFGLPAFEQNAVPTGDDKPEFPYLTYSVVDDSFGDEVAMAANLWYRSTSWLEAEQKTREISKAIGSGHILPCTGGAIWIKRGQPFAQSMGDDADDMIKRKYINITAEYFTAD